jgi:hypothetical protein
MKNIEFSPTWLTLWRAKQSAIMVTKFSLAVLLRHLVCLKVRVYLVDQFYYVNLMSQMS